MRLGIVVDNRWNFFKEIFEILSTHHQTSIYENKTYHLPILSNRINNRLFQHEMRGFLRENEVVFFEWAGELLRYATHLKKTCGIVTRLHRYELYQYADLINWDNVDKIILVSHAKQWEFVRRYPKHEQKIEVIPEYVSIRKFSPKPKQFDGNIGILCSFTPRKRIYELVLAFFELCQQVDGFYLHIGGEMAPNYVDYYEAIHDLVRNLGLETKVTFYGKVEDPQDWYHKIDIYVSNSYSEGLQVAPIEAMASGCYCLSHCWGGADDLLPATNLYFTNSELISKILCYREYSELEKNIQRALMREIACAKFDIFKVKNKILHTIEEARDWRK